MRKLILVLSLLVVSLIGYSQDVRVELLVHRDNAGYIDIAVEDYGNSTYITIGGDIVVKAHSFSRKGNLFTYNMSVDGVGIGAMYINLANDRFSVLLIDGTGWNGDIVSKEQTI